MAMREKKNKKELTPGFFRETKAELKKVTYPTGKQTRKATTVVIVVVIIVGVFIFGLDRLFGTARNAMLELPGWNASVVDEEATDTGYSMDENGNMIDSEGNIVMTAEELAAQQQSQENVLGTEPEGEITIPEGEVTIPEDETGGGTQQVEGEVEE